MATGLETSLGWVNAPTDLPGFGDYQWGADVGWPRAGVGGPNQDPSGMNQDTGFARIATGPSSDTMDVPGVGGRQVTDWRYLFNPDNPMFWVMVFSLAAVGFIHSRVMFRAGPASARVGVG